MRRPAARRHSSAKADAMSTESAEVSAAVTSAAEVPGSLAVPSGLRYVAVLGSGLEEAFPRPADGKASDSAGLPSCASSNTFTSVTSDPSKDTLLPRRTISSREVGDAEWGEGLDDVEMDDQHVGSGTRTRATTASTSTQAPELKLSDWANARSRRSNKRRTPNGRSGGDRPSSNPAAMGVKPPPPAWEPENLVTAGDASGAGATEGQSPEWNKEDEQDLRCRIRDTMAKIEGISGGLQDSGGKREAVDGGNGGRRQGAAAGSGPPPIGRGRRKNNQAGATVCQTNGDGSIQGLHDSLKISMELVATGEKHATANATAIEDMSEWLSGLEQKQLINIRQDEGIQGTTMASVILAEGLAVGDCIREYSDQTTSAYKRLASIFKTASTETERATKELVGRLTDVDVGGGEGEVVGGIGAGAVGAGGKEAAMGAATGKITSPELVIKAKKVERIKILQEKQLQEAAKTNEEAQAVINQLKASLQQLENRFRQAESMNTAVTTNRHKDTMRWRALALEYEMKISYLERALAQEESKLRIAEQVHREEGLELHLEMISKQRGQARDGTKSAAMQEELAALCTKLSAANARVVIMENTKAKLEQELASEKEKYRLLKAQRAAQGKEAVEEHEEELKSVAALYAKQMKEAEKLHEEELAVAKRQLSELREAHMEEAGRSEFEIKKLKGDLDIADQKAKARAAGGDERTATSQARLDALRDEQEKLIAESKYEKDTAQEVLQHTVQKFEAQLKEEAKLKTENGNQIAELEKEVDRLSARCKDLVEHREITSEERARIENALRQQHRLADEQKMQETAAHLAGVEAEKQTLLSRVLEAEAETERQRRAAGDLMLVLEEAKTAQSALQAAAAKERAEASVRASKPEKGNAEVTEAEIAARTKAADLEKDLSKANKRVEVLEMELTTAEQVAKDAEKMKKRAQEEVERAALAEEQARAAAEAARAAAEGGPNEHEQDMFRAEAILKTAVHELEERLETAEDEVDLLHNELVNAQESADELEEEMEELLDSRAKMRVEVHEAHCQIQRMTVERSSLRRQGAEAADLLTEAEALLREVTGCIDRTEHEATHSRVTGTLSVMRKRKVDERAVKMNRARDRIEAENRARVERALSAMRRLGHGNAGVNGGSHEDDVASRLERAPKHLRPILATFLSPSFKKAFLAYAKRFALGEVAFPPATSTVARQAGTTLQSASSPPATPGNSVTVVPDAAVAAAAAGAALPGACASKGNAAAAGGNPPPRRAISLDYPGTCPGHEATTLAASAAVASVPALARGAEQRRETAFGNAPPSKSEANLMAAGKHRSSMVPPGGRNGGDAGRGLGGGQSRRRSGARSKRELERRVGGVNRAAKWHKHRDPSSDFDVTLTAETASGRAASGSSQGRSAGDAAGTTGTGSTAAAATAAAAAEAATEAAEAIAVQARQLKAHRKDLKKREDGLQERLRLQEEIQRETERKSDELEAEAAKIVQPGPERDRLEGDLRNAIAELEAGAARMEELCRLSAEAAANMQETEHAYSSAMIEEAEAVKAAERAAAAAAREVTGGHKTGAAAASAPQATAAAAEGDDVRPATTLEDTRKSRKLVAETGDPSGTGAALDVVADQKQEKSGVLGAKRSAVNSATSDSKRRRRSRIGAPTSGDASIDTVHGAALTPFTAAAGPPELLPHPVFARREQAVREVEASAANPLAVVETYRHVQALAAKLASYEGKLVAAPSTAPASAAATTMETRRSTSPENKATEELEVLAESKAEAMKKLDGTSLESMLAAMELLAKAEPASDDSSSIDTSEAMKKQLRCNITSADIVEVSVALAEARILEREGTALLSRQRQSKRGADHKLKKNRAGDPSSPPTTPPSSVTEGGKRTATTAAHPAAATASEEGGTDAIDCTWTTEKAAENKRRLALLSESLEASDVQDLQILRRSLERQADESASRPPSEGNRLRREGSNRSRGGRAGRSAGAAATTAASEVLVVGEDERWRADVLGERLAAVTRAVERKGGWRSAVFVGKDGGEVNVDVDAEPWPAAEGVLMLQTVKDALYVQLMETRSRVEELEDVAALVSGRGELETHLEATADLHRTVALLWEGVGDLLHSQSGHKRSSRAEATRSESTAAPLPREVVPRTSEAPQERSAAGAAGTSDHSVATAAGRDAILILVRDEDSRDTPMHLEGLPLPTVTNALSLDVAKIQASTKFLISGLLDALAAEAAAKGEATAASLRLQQQHRDAASNRAASPEILPPSTPAAPVPPMPSLPAAAVASPRVPSPQSVPSEAETRSPPESDREIVSAPGSEKVSWEDGEEVQRRALSTAQSDGGRSPEEIGEEHGDIELQVIDDPGLTARTSTPEEEPGEEVDPSPPTPQDTTPPSHEGATQEELDEAWERAREMEETARGLREVVEERGGVIGLLQREVEDLKAALADAETRMSVPLDPGPPAVDPRLEEELQKAMSALGDERAFLADTAQKLDTSLEERERLLGEVAESKVKEQQLETMLVEVRGRERQLVAEIEQLQQLKVADGATLERLDAQIEEDPGLDEPALEELRSKRRQKARNITDTNGRLKVARSQHENMWERAMKSYKWVHHLPQISVKNRKYKSIQEWIEAEIADQRKARKKIERAALLRSQKLQSRGLLQSNRDRLPFSTGSLAPVLVTPLSGSLGLSSRSMPTTAWSGDGRRGYGYGYGSGGLPGSQRDLKVGNLMIGKSPAGDYGEEVSHDLRRAQVQPKTQDEQGIYRSNSAFDHFQDNQYRQQTSSRPGGPSSPSSPAITVSIPSPPLEKGLSSPKTTFAGGKNTVGYSTTAYEASVGIGNDGRSAALTSRPTPNEAAVAAAAAAADHQRYKSLFTNAPAELPAVTVLPVGSGDDNYLAGSASPQHRTGNPAEALGKGRGAVNTTSGVGADTGGSGDIDRPPSYMYRRAQTVKMDYHNTLRRKSSNTSFTHPVGHPSGLNATVQFRSHPDFLRGWGDGQAEGATGTGGSSNAAVRKRGGNVPVEAGATTPGQEEPFRWIPGAHSDRRPVVHSHGSNEGPDSSSVRGRTSTPTKAAAVVHGAPGPASSTSSVDAAATANRFARTSAPTGGRPGGRGEWVDPRASSLLSPSNSASRTALPRQLAVPGSLLVAQQGAAVTGGGIGNAAGGMPSSADRHRLRHSMSAASGGGSRKPGGADSSGRRGEGAERNNLHPAWRPKGLTRRQRATSVIQRG